MILTALRAFFVLLMAAVGWHFVKEQAGAKDLPFQNAWLNLAMMLVLAVFIVCVDYLSPRRKLAIFSGTFLGLIIGMIVAYALSFAVALLVDRYMPDPGDMTLRTYIENYVSLVIGVICTYLSVSFILQTKDDFRFIIPYVEFSKQMRGAKPILLDTNVLIDGRIGDIAETGILESRLIVPKFVLDELHAIADSGDKLKRNRGRRGLEVLQRLQNNKRTEVILYDSSAPQRDEGQDVDSELMTLASRLIARVLTNDFSLNKIALLRGVDVININDLAKALKPVVLPGETMTVRLIKAGELAGQAVGYLDDGTMVVVEHARQFINQDIGVTVYNVRQTSAGNMIFGGIQDDHPTQPEPRPGRSTSQHHSTSHPTES